MISYEKFKLPATAGIKLVIDTKTNEVTDIAITDVGNWCVYHTSNQVEWSVKELYILPRKEVVNTMYVRFLNEQIQSLPIEKRDGNIYLKDV